MQFVETDGKFKVTQVHGAEVRPGIWEVSVRTDRGIGATGTGRSFFYALAVAVEGLRQEVGAG